jgi:hypothetical protein
MSKTPEELAGPCAERAIAAHNNKTVVTQKDLNQLFVGCFMEGFIVGRRAGIPDKVKMVQDAAKLAYLESEQQLIRDSIKEVESHYLTRCVRFLQSFHKRMWWKAKDISIAFRCLVKAILPRKNDEHDYRTPLYQTLQKHLEENENT